MTAGPVRLCLVGSGIAQSPSPAMHQAAFLAAGVEGGYVLRDVTPPELPALLAELRTGRYRGCNVTTPYKFALAAVCDQLEGDAETLQAVNTITVRGGRLIGENTDADGFELALSTDRMWPPPRCTALVLGAGGAAAAVALALSRVRLLRLRIAARNPDAALRLAEQLRGTGDVETVSWEPRALQAAGARANIVVNATSAGLASLPLDPRELPASCTVADVRYRPRPVDVVEAARQSGHRASDGLEMLLWQGLLSFEIWTGVTPNLEAVREALHRAVGE